MFLLLLNLKLNHKVYYVSKINTFLEPFRKISQTDSSPREEVPAILPNLRLEVLSFLPTIACSIHSQLFAVYAGCLYLAVLRGPSMCVW